MTITAVITAHRRPSELRRAITSVQAQSMPVIEILVCEDGHDPDIQRVVALAAESDSRVQHLHLTSGVRGPGAGRNLGITHAHGDWIAFLDDDDVWLETKLQSQSKYFGKSDLVCSNASLTSGGNYFREKGSYRVSRMQMLWANQIITSTSVVRRALITQIGGFSSDPRIMGIEDYECWMRLSDLGARITFVDAVTVTYSDVGMRLSRETIHLSDVLASLALRRAFNHPCDPTVWLAAGRHAAGRGAARIRLQLQRSDG